MTSKTLMSPDSIDALTPCLKTAFERKAEDIKALYVAKLTSYTDAIVIITAGSERQVSAIAEHIHTAMKQQGKIPLGTEGLQTGKWALLDFGDFIVHVFDKETRDFYDIAGLWSDAPKIDLSAFETRKPKQS
ncbi:MAG: ribosome silencing factor [Pseudomonadota bacterium]